MRVRKLVLYQRGKTIRQYLALQLSSLKDSCYWADGIIYAEGEWAQGDNRIRELTTPIVHLEKKIHDQPVPTDTKCSGSSRLAVRCG